MRIEPIVLHRAMLTVLAAGAVSRSAAAQEPVEHPSNQTPSTLSGDWGGRRSDLEARGLTFELGWTQVAQGVVDGGRRRDWDFGGNLQFSMGVDFERLGLGKAGSLSFTAESRYGETVNDDSGAFTPVNTRGYFPLAGSVNEGIPLTVTELAWSFPIGETLEVTIGKMITADGDPTEFAGGRGRSQFLNSNFIYNVATSQTAPYSTIGAEIDWTPAKWFALRNALFATTDSSTTTGFDHLNDGWTWWSQIETQYRLGGLPGGANLGGLYAFGNQFTKIDGKLTLIPGGVALQTVNHSWAVFGGAWQYLYTAEAPPEEIDASDGHADVRGLGLFTRIGFADPDANPVDWSGSIGLGGRGMIPGRGEDSFGVGYYYTHVRTPRILMIAGLASHGQGFEAYYNIALTDAVRLTLDVQWVQGGVQGFSPATVLGLRLDVAF